MEKIKALRFKSKHTLDKRETLSKKVKDKYPDKIPIIIEQGKNVPNTNKEKYIISRDTTISKLIKCIKRNYEEKDIHSIEDYTKPIFLFINNELLTYKDSDKLSIVYDKYKDIDGFLYITYHGRCFIEPDLYQWMYGDAGFLPFFTVQNSVYSNINRISYLNPLRWSSNKMICDVIEELNNISQKQRPIILHKKDNSPNYYTIAQNVEEAIDILQGNTTGKSFYLM